MNDDTREITIQEVAMATSYAWNGPTCPICHKPYLGGHSCAVDDLQAQIDALQRMIDARRNAPRSVPGLPGLTFDPSLCPCNPARGGSGLCGCTLNTPTVTC